MPFTQFCDLFGAVGEAAFNNLVLDLERQRPSLFNYGTISFVNNPGLLCDQSIVTTLDPDVAKFGNPVVKELPLLNLPGYNGSLGLEYCLQFSGLTIDFQPSNVIQLPAGLNPPLQLQHFALQAKVCAGIGCPATTTLLAAAQATTPSAITQLPAASVPIPFQNNVVCFCLDLYAVLHVQQSTVNNVTVISLTLDNLELPGLQPAGLEQAIECFIRTTLILGILPQISIAYSSLVFNIGGLLTLFPTPISANVPFNPSIQTDQIQVFLSLN
jgi:hypothetical protein